MPCLPAKLGHKHLPWLLTALEQVYRCSKTVANKVEQAGLEGIPALVVSVEEERLQSLLQTVTVTHCVTQDKGLDCHVLQFPFL